MKNKHLIIVLLLCSHTLLGQHLSYFNKTYWADTINLLATVCEQVETGYLTIGNYAKVDYWATYIRKLDTIGETEWIKEFDTSVGTNELGTIDWGARVIKDNKHLLVAYEKEQDIKLAKLDFNGDTVWIKRYSKINRQHAKQIIKTTDSGYIIGGMEGVVANDTVKAYVLKLDSLGNFEWDRYYTMGNDARFFTVQQTPWDDGYIFGGMGYSTATGYDMFVVKTDSIGDTLWTRHYGGIYHDCACQIVPNTSLQDYEAGSPIEYIMTACWYDSENWWESKSYIAKLDSVGGIIWQHKLTNYPDFSSIQTPLIVRQGGRAIGVATFENIYTVRNPVIVSFRADGTIEWSKPITLDPTKSSYIKDMRPTEDGGYVLAGYQYSSPQTAWVLKIDSLGNTCSFVGCDSTIYTGVNAASPLPPPKEGELQVYPNPATNQLHITSTIPATFVLYDLLGRAVRQVGLGSGTVQVSVLGLPAGTYFYQIINPQKQILQHEKLIVLH